MFLNTHLLKQLLATLYIIMRNWTQVSVQSSWRGWTSKYVTDVLLLLDWGQGPSVRLLVSYSSATPSSALTCSLPSLTLTSDSHRVRAGLVFTSCSGLSPWCGSCPVTCSDGAHLKQAHWAHPDSPDLWRALPPVPCHGTPGSNDKTDLSWRWPAWLLLQGHGTNISPTRVYQHHGGPSD